MPHENHQQMLGGDAGSGTGAVLVPGKSVWQGRTLMKSHTRGRAVAVAPVLLLGALANLGAAANPNAKVEQTVSSSPAGTNLHAYATNCGDGTSYMPPEANP